MSIFNVGHVSLGATEAAACDSGVTAIYCGPQGALASVDVRGGGPGTRETDLLAPYNTVERVHAVILSGGSAFGLACADGAMRELARHDIGFPVFGDNVPGPRVPIVPAAVIFDLIVGEIRYPDAADGAEALRRAMSGNDDTRGTVGAGCGATAGHLRGGFGRARVELSDGHVVEAVIVANPVGEVIDRATGRLYGDPAREPIDKDAYTAVPHPAAAKLNTTIGAVFTDAPVTKAQAKRIAMAAHDGIGRAVRPAHSPLDGDTLFALSSAPAPTGVDIPTLAALCAAAADAVEAAIVDAVVNAAPGVGPTSAITAYSQLLQ